jgi:phosphoenolpyruvate-protein kinase (PTS system EI component)
MKRVHQYDGPTTEPSPPAMPGQGQRKTINRKRKASTEETSEKRQKAAKITAEQLRQQARDQLAQQFAIKKQHIIDILNNLSNPNELQDDIQLTKEVVGLHEICTKFRANYGG